MAERRAGADGDAGRKDRDAQRAEDGRAPATPPVEGHDAFDAEATVDSPPPAADPLVGASGSASAPAAEALTAAMDEGPASRPGASEEVTLAPGRHDFFTDQTLALPEGEEPGAPQTVADLLSRAQGEAKYVVDAEIARGGMGAILRSVDRNIRREVAMKVMLREADERTRMRFVEEAQVTGQLSHPNTPPVYDLGFDAEGQLYFTMKLVKGISLAELLAEAAAQPGSLETRLSLHKLLSIFTRICDAVAFAHSRGVVHRDLKPANVMLGDYGEVLVMDWGLAKVGATRRARSGRRLSEPDEEIQAAADRELAEMVSSLRSEAGSDLTLDGQVAGTPQYMPPEQAAGRIDDIDERSDVYALGAILYEMLSLQPPVGGDNLHAVLAAAAGGEVVPLQARRSPRRIPRELAAIAMKCLSRRAGERYASVSDLLEDLHAFQEGRSVSAAPDTLLQRAVKLAKRHRGVALTGAASLALLLALGVVSYLAVLAERDVAVAQRGRAERAAAAAQSARRQAEHNARAARRAEGRARTALQETEAARQALKKNIRVTAQRFARQAVEMTAQGRYLDAEARLDDARLIAADHPDVWYALGRLRQAQKRHEEATAAFRRALELAPEHPSARAMLAASATALEEAEEVEADMLMSGLAGEGLAGVDAEARALRGDSDLLLEANRPADDEGLAAAADAPLSDFVDWRALLRHAGSLRKVGRLQDALGVCTKAVMLMEQEHVAAAELNDARRLRQDLEVRVACEEWFQKRRDLGAKARREGTIRMLRETNLVVNEPHLMPKYDWTVTEGGLISLRVRGIRIQYLEALRGLRIRRLELDDASELRGLEALRGMPLQALRIRHACGITDLSPLAGMPLESLELITEDRAKPPLTDLAPLQGLPLRTLHLMSSELHDLSPLAGLPLRRLVVRSDRLRDIAPLATLKELEEVWLCGRVADLRPLRGLPLRILKLNNTILRDLGPLRGMSLQELRLSFCVNLRSLAPLREVEAESLVIERCWEGIEDPSGVHHVAQYGIQRSAASVHLKWNRFREAEARYRYLLAHWPEHRDVALRGLRAVAQAYLQRAVPISFRDLQYRNDGLLRLAAEPLPPAAVGDVLAVCDLIEKEARQPARLAAARLLRARHLAERGDLPRAREALRAAAAMDVATPPPEVIAACYVLGEPLVLDDDFVVPTRADLGVVDEAVLREVGQSIDYHDLRFPFGPTEVTLHKVYSDTEVAPHVDRPARVVLATTPATAFFFPALRALLAGKEQAAAAELALCLQVAPESSYGCQARRLLARLGRQAPADGTAADGEGE